VAYRVLMLDPSNYTPFYNQPLCSALVEKGVNVRLYTSHTIYESDQLLKPYIQYHFYRAVSRLGLKGRARHVAGLLEHPLDWLQILLSLENARSEPVLHTQWLPLVDLDLFFLRLARWRGAALVHTVHNLIPHKEGRGSKEAFGRLYALVDGLIAHTQFTADSLKSEFNVPSHKIHVVPIGAIDVMRAPIPMPDARQHLNLPLDAPVILFLGTVREEKGLPFLIKAFPRVLKAHPNAYLAIVGQPLAISPTQIFAQIKEAGIPQERVITRLMFVPDDNLPVYLGAADMTVYPYVKIDQSGSLMLSLTLGTPAVVTDVGGLAEVVTDGVNGRVVPPCDAARLAAAISELLIDRAKLHQIRNTIHKKTLEEYSWTRIAAKTATVYETVLRMRYDSRH
jgi:glycosyltransferase involved in cell wall biosynthesis